MELVTYIHHCMVLQIYQDLLNFQKSLKTWRDLQHVQFIKI